MPSCYEVMDLIYYFPAENNIVHALKQFYRYIFEVEYLQRLNNISSPLLSSAEYNCRLGMDEYFLISGSFV